MGNKWFPMVLLLYFCKKLLWRNKKFLQNDASISLMKIGKHNHYAFCIFFLQTLSWSDNYFKKKNETNTRKKFYAILLVFCLCKSNHPKAFLTFQVVWLASLSLLLTSKFKTQTSKMLWLDWQTPLPELHRKIVSALRKFAKQRVCICCCFVLFPCVQTSVSRSREHLLVR